MRASVYPANCRGKASLPTTGVRRTRGFTLAELLVTIAIVAIASTIAVPGMSNLIADASASSQAEVLMNSVNFTRSEAVKRNQRVTMCVSSSGSDCAAAGAVGNWKEGWIVFVDDGATVGAVDSGEEILRVQSKLTASGKLDGFGDVNAYVSYASNGQTRLGNAGAQVGHFISCAKSTTVKRRQVNFTAGTGWVGIQQISPASDKNNCSA